VTDATLGHLVMQCAQLSHLVNFYSF